MSAKAGSSACVETTGLGFARVTLGDVERGFAITRGVGLSCNALTNLGSTDR